MGGLTLPSALLTVILVMFMAYWCSKLLGKNWSHAANGKNMKIIDQIQLGQDKRLILVKLGEHNYLLGVSQAGIQLLTEAEGEFEESQTSVQMENPSFKDMMERYLDSHWKKGGGQ